MPVTLKRAVCRTRGVSGCKFHPSWTRMVEIAALIPCKGEAGHRPEGEPSFPKAHEPEGESIIQDPPHTHLLGCGGGCQHLDAVVGMVDLHARHTELRVLEQQRLRRP